MCICNSDKLKSTKETNNEHYFVVMTSYSKVHKRIQFPKELYFFIMAIE